MSDTDAPAVPDPGTAAGRLRILWGATADPQLAMSTDEIDDVQTVLDEHAAMAAELQRLRGMLGHVHEQWGVSWPGSDWVDKTCGEQGARDWIAEYSNVIDEIGGMPRVKRRSIAIMPWCDVDPAVTDPE